MSPNYTTSFYNKTTPSHDTTSGGFKSARARKTWVEWRLRNIEKNPGPQQGRSWRRYERRVKRREKHRQDKNVARQGTENWYLECATSQPDGESFRLHHPKEHKRSLGFGLVTEIDARSEGLRECHNQKRDRFLVHSKKVGVLINLDAFNIWNKQGRKKLITERLVLVKIDNVNYISTYFPVQGSEGYEQTLQETLHSKNNHSRPSKERSGYHWWRFYAQIGTGNENNGNQGMSTTNQQGRELLDWLAENDLCWVNFFYIHSGRGTGRHPGSGQWYELDGFVTRTNHRHGVFKRVRTGNHQGLSDHNPKLAYLNEGFKKRWEEKTKNIKKTPRRSNIAWKKLWNKEKRDVFMVKTGNIEIQKTGNFFKKWKKVEKGVMRTAEQVCGIKKRQTNDWLAGHM